MTIADAAAFLAQQWPCFPCDARKRPITPRGFYDATSHPAAVRAMFQSPDAALIGVPMGPASGLLCLDIDAGKGGLEWLDAQAEKLPPTRTHRTMNGGRHLFFKWPKGRNLRNRASKWAPGVDIRAEGGYAIMPPSPGYEIVDASMPADAPAWLLDLIDPPAPQPQVAIPYTPPSARIPDRYAEAALDGECKAVASAPEGQRNDTLNVAAVKLGSLVAAGALSESTVRAELRRAALHAGLDPRETDLTIASGLAYGLTQPRQAPERQQRIPHQPPAIGANGAIGSGAEAPARQAEQPSTEDPKVFPTLTLDEIEALPPPVWLIEGLLVQNSNASLIAPPKSLKSFLALDWALHIAYGINWKGKAVKQGGVLYIAGEGVGGMARRIAAWRAFHGCSGDNAPFRLIAVPFRIMRDDHVAAAIATAKAMMEADGYPVSLIVNDTLARSMAGADENSAKDMGIAVGGIDEIRTETAAAMLTVHHTGKDKERGARGSSALLGAVDTEIVVTREESILKVKVTAQKDAEEGDEIILQVRKVGTDGRDPAEGQPSSLVLVEAPNDAAPPKRPALNLTGGEFAGRRALIEALAGHGQEPPDIPDIPSSVRRVCTLSTWRREFYGRSTLDTQEAKQKAFKRAAEGLAQKGVVGVWNDLVWSANDAE